MVERLEVEISVKNNIKPWLDNVRDDLEWFKTRMQSQEALNLSINLAKLRQELKNINTIIKENEKNWQFDINLSAKAELLKQQITWAWRELRNFTRTGQKDVSVLWNLFWWMGNKINWLANSFKTSLTPLMWIMGSIFWITAITAFGKKLIWLWSDLTEFQSKFNTTFWSLATQGNTVFDNLSQKLGRSAMDLKNYWATLANILQPLWFTTQESLDLSAAITELWIDIASFNNVSDDQAINAMRWAITWEREALKWLWIVLLDTDIKQNAYANWIAKTGNALTKQQQALSTLQLLYKATNNAQWDAVRTWDSFANQLKRLSWIVTDTMANAWKDIAINSSWMLSDLGIMIWAYWSSLITVIIDTVKWIWEVLWWAVSWLVTLYNTLTTSWEESTQSQLSWIWLLAKWFEILWLWIQGISTIIQSLWIMLWWILSDWYEAIKLFVNSWWIVFKWLWNIVATVFSWIWTTIVVSFKQVINDLITKLNWFSWQANKLLEKVWLKIWTIDYIDVWKAKSFKDIVKWIWVDLKKMSNEAKPVLENFMAWFGKGTWKETTKQITDLWTNLWAKTIESNKKIEDSFSKQLAIQQKLKQWEDYNKKLAQDKINNEKKLQELIESYKKWVGVKSWAWKTAEQLAKAEETKAKEAAKKALDIKIQALEDAANMEIESIKKSQLNERQKAIQILAINEKLNNDKQLLQWKTIELEKQWADEVLKKVEKNKDEEIKKYWEINAKTEDWIKKLEDYWKQIVENGEKMWEFKEWVVKDIEEINNSLAELWTEQDIKILDRRTELLKDQTEIQKKLNDAKQEWIDIQLAESIWKSLLSQMWWNQEIGTQKVSDLIELLDNTTKLKDIKEELLLIDSKTTEEQRKQWEINAKKSETQKIIDEIALKKKSLEEQKWIANAVIAWREAQITAENWILTWFYTNDKWEQVAITEFKNLQYAQDLVNKQLSLDNELIAIKSNYQLQVIALTEYNTQRLKAESEYTLAFWVEMEKRKQIVDDLRAKLEAVKSLNEQIGIAKAMEETKASQNKTTTINKWIWNLNVYNNVDLDSALRPFNSK